jgi:hypothetical protein
MITLCRNTGEEYDAFYSKLNDVYPGHPYLEAERQASELFDQCIS